MKLADLTELAARNLRESLLRNGLTTMGIAVGVASLVAMLALGVGLQNMVGARLERTGLFDSIAVRPRQVLAGQNAAARQRGLANGSIAALDEAPRALDEAARAQIAKLTSVTEVYPELRFTGDMRLGDDGRVTLVSSLPASAASSDAIEGMQGRFFSSPQAHEVILQLDFATDLAAIQHLQPGDLLGKDLVMRYAGREPIPPPGSAAAKTAAGGSARQPGPYDSAMGFSVVSSELPLRVVGIVNAEAVPSGALGAARSGAYLPVAVCEALGVVQGNDMNEIIRSAVEGGGRRYNNLTVRVKSPNDVPAVEDAAKQMGFAAFSLLDVTRNLRRAFAVIDLLLGIFGSLALTVASLGIVNTLVMSILERRREIGVLKALGASDRDVRQLFFAEAAVMGLCGGVLGIGLGWAIGSAIQLVTTYYLRRQQIPPEQIWILPGWLIAGAIAFSLVVSLAAGIYPASRAAKLDPVEALRLE